MAVTSSPPGDAPDREPRRSRSTEAFYGRRHGRPVSPLAADAVARQAPRVMLELDEPAPADLRSLFADSVGDVRLEIGFGGGEHLLAEARRERGSGFIGVEPFVGGMAKLLQALDGEPLGNIRVYNDDATRVLDWLPANSISELDLLYPDPWPKKKHWKRRFVSSANLARFARVVKPGGLFRFASDIPHYVNWTLLHVRAQGDFTWLAQHAGDWREPYPHWCSTRYESKALREGRTPAYLTFRRH
ncbi:tRNA (guanine(46)-N(7))-methyltransferase TrmB [Tianweitania sediminis]|uniref:tRNA (guanine-N(7)-)-methyltransferase n=1 Tax=Tianweitania sediminis TaxID=1502156 RepID=A0A8J7RNW5_9HYPH|nr:tRNA (guanine(46)-N(7))-methyltransferase TrmB [Tianweitania sediminis]MBP0440526.1 tRNA (guanosine(46)-N7)-methyltransferase TrmB [Tianweitania sediminis]